MSGRWTCLLVVLQRGGLSLVTALALTSLLAVPTWGAQLKPATTAAFNRYILSTEARVTRDLQDGRFLFVDDLPDENRREAYARIRKGGVFIEHLRAEEKNKPIKIPHGLIHHWVGIVFIPGVTLAETIAELQDYADQPTHYAPTVRQARILQHSGNEFKVFRQLYHKRLVTVVLNAEFDDVYDILNASQATVRSYSTRIAEVADWNQPDEHELPVGNDHGYVWRYYSYSHMEEKDGGVYMQIEVVTLSRAVPVVFAWLVDPLMPRIARRGLTELLVQTRQAILEDKSRQTGFFVIN